PSYGVVAMRRSRSCWFCLGLGLFLAGGFCWLITPARQQGIAAEAPAGDAAGAKPADFEDSADADHADQLPRIPPVSPADTLKTFEVQPGFRIDQVACEPLVTDPVAMAFDENGRLFVCEMNGYSEDGDKPLGGVRMLVDTDGDGHFDQSTRYVDDLA